MADVPHYAFGPFTLHPAQRRLLDMGQPVALGARAFDLLVALVEGQDRTLSKAELMRLVWPDSAVEENNLTVNISALRKALRERPNDQLYIRTVSGRGYRFVAPLRNLSDERAGNGGSGNGGADNGGGPARVVMAETPSIAVLPFETAGEEPAHERFGDGIAEGIIAELSRNRWLTVIARNSSFSFRDSVPGPVEIAEVARKLGVRYVLDGTVRTAGARVRVTAHLVDASTTSTLVTERYDRELSDIFSVQDEITSRIAETVRPALYEAEQDRSMRRHPDSLDAWAAYQRGVWHFSRHGLPESVDARDWFERAIALDKRFAPAHYGLALVYLHDGSGFMPEAVPDWQKRGEQLALQAVALDGRDSGAHAILGLARMVRGDHAGALEATSQALALNPSDVTAHGTRGATLVFSERPLEGLAALETCLRLDPRNPRLRIRQAHLGLGHFFADQPEAAEAYALELIHSWPRWAFGPRLLAMVCAEAGRIEEARAAMATVRALSPAALDNFSHARMPWYGVAAHARALAALRRAGLDG